MNSNNKEFIGINSFVRRQIKGSGQTYSTLSFEDIKDHAEKQLKSNIYKKGYRDGVILIPVNKKLLHHFICPIVKINKNRSQPKRWTRNQNIIK